MGNNEITKRETNSLYQAITLINTEKECEKFFSDLFTINEIRSAAQRLEVARLLKEKITFSEIERLTGASSATISRVNRTLNYGTGGYDEVLEKLK